MSSTKRETMYVKLIVPIEDGRAEDGSGDICVILPKDAEQWKQALEVSVRDHGGISMTVDNLGYGGGSVRIGFCTAAPDLSPYDTDHADDCFNFTVTRETLDAMIRALQIAHDEFLTHGE